MANVRPLYADRQLPLLLEADDDVGAGLGPFCAWALTNRPQIREWLNEAGAVLMRGFAIRSADEFRRACAAVSPELQNYVGGDSPRHSVTDQVYTSTEYPAHSEVLLHNELSYSGWSPDQVYFCCLVPSESGGETHIADGREIYCRLDADVRRRFETNGVTYLQHLWDAEGPPGPGKSWQETFETSDRREAEAYLERSNMMFRWTPLGIRTSATHPAALEHSETGQKCWHNQADQWHRDVASVKDAVPGSPDAEKGTNTAGTESLGNHVTFGDGSEIDVADLMHIREVSRKCEVLFTWQQGDLMVIDNVMAMHVRKPFTGSRRVLVAMA
ncbi:MAG: TauD/TfdA family dioxygenase [Pseudomonadota bacterium]